MYGILLYEGVEPIDVGATFGVLSMAKRLCPDLQVAGIARRQGLVQCANGLQVMADYQFGDAPACTDLIVTGGPGWTRAAQDSDTLDFLRSTTARLTAICTGAMILAAADRLQGHRATTKAEVFAGEASPLQQLDGDVRAVKAAIVEDQNIVTSGGVTLGIDAMFYCLARSHGQAVADETARVMEYTRALAANRDALGYA